MLELNIINMAAVPNRISPERCLHQRHLGANCLNCVHVCYTEAIRLEEREILFDESLCLGCGACLAACPVECFETDEWSEQALLKAAQTTPERPLEIACKWHPAPHWVVAPAAAIQVGTCLAAISPGVWFELGLTREVGVHLEYCEGCPLSNCKYVIGSALARANELLGSLGRPSTLVARHNAFEAAPSAPSKVVEAERPPMNRREFFFSFARSSGVPAQSLASLPDVLPENAKGERLPPHLPAWLRRLAAVYSTQTGTTQPVPDSSHKGDGAGAGMAFWPTLAVDEGCVACGACVRYCPSGALSIDVTNSAYEHHFIPGICIGCGLCAQVCTPGAIERSYSFDSAPFQVRAIAGRLVGKCPVCGEPAVNSPDGRCYWCTNEPPLHQLLDNIKASFPFGKGK